MSYNNNAISSDDPKAVEKLTEKLNKCEKEQEFMKKVNSYYKKNGTVKGCEGVSDELAAKLDKRVQEAYSWERQPFPPYRLTNNNGKYAVSRSVSKILKQARTRSLSAGSLRAAKPL